MENAIEDLNCAEQGMAGMGLGVVAEPHTFQSNIFWVCGACDITFAHLGRTPPHCPGCGCVAARLAFR